MKPQDCALYKLPASKMELMEIFEKYEFRDSHGHPLALCLEFIQLIDHYCQLRKEVPGQ